MCQQTEKVDQKLQDTLHKRKNKQPQIREKMFNLISNQGTHS